MKILAVGAHPDDVEIGCGGVLLQSVQAKKEVYIYFLTRGEAGGIDADQRENEARTSAKVIGAKDIFFDEFEDTRLTPSGTLVDHIEEIVNKVRPDLILTHARTDEHHDHRAVGLCTIEAARYYPKIWAYENPLTKVFQPQIFVDITTVINQKVQLISLYNTQRGKQYLKEDAIYGLAQYRALQSRLNANSVEAYQVVKCIGNCMTCKS
jgi:LmbE family N-acetylglucosaminyl deacetylase